MCDYDEKVKMPINEPAAGLRKSQIQEYVEYHGGAGVQHVALNTPDILHAITNLQARGLECLRVPAAYYEDVKKRLAKSPVKVRASRMYMESAHLSPVGWFGDLRSRRTLTSWRSWAF